MFAAHESALGQFDHVLEALGYRHWRGGHGGMEIIGIASKQWFGVPPYWKERGIIFSGTLTGDVVTDYNNIVFIAEKCGYGV